ncbi:hypothetical protein C8R48DRAFT_778240 [Suillus tomentosus]|nr:hypothetical protein C8R48DRAFT_778240 [Suillus tomentosus]
MPTFNVAMLNSTPSPEPVPVAQGPPEDAPMGDASAESDTDRLFTAWASILVSLEGCWYSVLATLNGCSTRAGVLAVALEMDDKSTELLKQGWKSCKEIEAVVKDWKAKAIASVPQAPPMQAACATGASEVEARATDVSGTDASKKPCVGRLSVVKARRCGACIAKDIDCGGARLVAGALLVMCPSALALSRNITDAPKACPRKPMPKCPIAESAKETTSSIAVEDEEESEESEMDVEIVGERSVEEKVVRASCDIPVRAVGPLASGSAPKGKDKFKDPAVELKEARAEAARLKEENAHLRTSTLQMRQYARAQQADLLNYSNKFFAMSNMWAELERQINDSLK